MKSQLLKQALFILLISFAPIASWACSNTDPCPKGETCFRGQCSFGSQDKAADQTWTNSGYEKR